MNGKTRVAMFLGLALFASSCNGENTENRENRENGEKGDAYRNSHHRAKRLFWITNDGRMALPPGTIMTITPTLALPFVRYPPSGFLSNMSISLPFTVDFDKLGLTDNENPYGVLPTAFDGRGREAGMATAEFIAAFVKRGISKRDVANEMPKDAFHGGERALLYGTAEDMLAAFGLNGKACILRAICEVQSHPLSNFGLIGEMLKLFFTASKSPFASLLEEYVAAEKRGKYHGECWPYFKECPKSLFLPSANRYTKNAIHEDTNTRTEYTDWILPSDNTENDQRANRGANRGANPRTVHPSM